MSQFLETSDDLLRPMDLSSSLVQYIIPEFYSSLERLPFAVFINDGGKEWIQKMLSNPNHKLNMYGSAEELVENLKIFRNHPEAWRFLPDRNDPFHASAKIYYSLNNDPYILKSDLFVILQNMAFQNLPEILQDIDVSKAVLGTILKAHVCASSNGSVEFVKFDQKVFDELEKELQEEFEKAEKFNCNRYVIELEKKNYHKIAAELGKLNSTIWNEAEKRELIHDLFPSLESDCGSIRMMVICSHFIATRCANCLEKVISQHPEIFKPITSLPTVRVFEDGDQRFVICKEIQNALDRDLAGKMARRNKLFFFLTRPMQKIAEEQDEIMQNIEFIRTPILRAKHRAVLIPLGSVRFGILAADMLFEFLRNLIFGQKAFQKQTPEFLQDFKVFDIFFNSEIKDIYFLNTEVGEKLVEAAKAALRNVENIPAKDVRSAKKDGFTVQNLKNELAHLGLLNAFPEIQNHAEVVYSEVDKRKKEQFLRTCDLFDAIEHCQLICILSRLPKIRKFLHNQKGCQRVYGYKCEQCEEEKKEAQKTLELQKPSEPPKIEENEQKMFELQNSSRVENLEKELAQMKLHLEKTLLENQKFQSENQKLSIKNDKKALISTKSSNTQFLDKKLNTPDTVLACTSNRIQCLICEIHVDSSNKDDIIRCPLCKRRFHKKCAFEWLKEHKQCPACNGDLPKI